ncbi:uncharacterized protein F4812DRAFT_456281 [Daldinia caldariorum]|uniref:uncharacterized protein n=1 Tax=Daldinia caldariorum TaxID=326644 RepID=UPI0020087C24|nr:uncharacterized protein F4812DRAFT_456281 [Daldinia caldariorum]KAI1470277.1 hypothetical protein F4812DRAFT_456281 [Daldinia caldariorum]
MSVHSRNEPHDCGDGDGDQARSIQISKSSNGDIIFTSEFYAIGALFAVYGVTVLLCSIYRRYQGNTQFFSEAGNNGEVTNKFRTSGNSVLLLTCLSIGAYIGLMVLTWQLEA